MEFGASSGAVDPWNGTHFRLHLVRSEGAQRTQHTMGDLEQPHNFERIRGNFRSWDHEYLFYL